MQTRTDLDSIGISLPKAIGCYLLIPGKADLTEEFKFLIISAGFDLVDFYVQKRYPTSGFYFGEGFWNNLSLEIEKSSDNEDKRESPAIIVNAHLTPYQYSNISKKFNLLIIDQFKLILEIFSRRASTQEAILQIELARLKYNLPFEKNHLTMQRVEGERLGWGQTGELKGPQLDSIYRKNEATIRKKLTVIKTQRASRRKQRENLAKSGETLSLAIMGYTSSGKSTFFNALTGANAVVGTKYFTTLGTTTRVCQYHDLPIMLTDTVGFFEALPSTLIDAFNSTLEESFASDYILILVDSSDPVTEIKRKLESSLKTLSSIDPEILGRVWIVLTKADLVPIGDSFSLTSEVVMESLSSYGLNGDICRTSSKSNDFQSFFVLIDKYLPAHRYRVFLSGNYSHQRSRLFSDTKVISERITEGGSSEFLIDTRRPKKIEAFFHSSQIAFEHLGLSQSNPQPSEGS